MRHRNKLLFVFLVFLFAALFVGSMAIGAKHRQLGSVISWIGQIGMGISILLFLVVPNKPKDEDV